MSNAHGDYIHDEIQALDTALDAFANDMRARLHAKAKAGYRGWDDECCQQRIVCDMLNDVVGVTHGDRTHLHDIANRAMMLWWQAWGGKHQGARE